MTDIFSAVVVLGLGAIFRSLFGLFADEKYYKMRKQLLYFVFNTDDWQEKVKWYKGLHESKFSFFNLKYDIKAAFHTDEYVTGKYRDEFFEWKHQAKADKKPILHKRAIVVKKTTME